MGEGEGRGGEGRGEEGKEEKRSEGKGRKAKAKKGKEIKGKDYYPHTRTNTSAKACHTVVDSKCYDDSERLSECLLSGILYIMRDKLNYIIPATSPCVPSRLTTYLPVKPEAPNTVTTSPLNEERPPLPRLVWLDTLLTNCNEFETADSLRTSVHFVAAISQAQTEILRYLAFVQERVGLWAWPIFIAKNSVVPRDAMDVNAEEHRGKSAVVRTKSAASTGKQTSASKAATPSTPRAATARTAMGEYVVPEGGRPLTAQG